MKQFWDDRFSEKEYVYGVEPNSWFKQVIKSQPVGKALIPGAGEGRDAVYAASLGWKVYAFDQSAQGCIKAMKLARQNGVLIRYDVIDAEDFDPQNEKFDLIAMVFFHLPPDLRRQFHRKLLNWLNPGGKLLIEAFHPRQIHKTSGGPKDLSLLMTASQLADDFRKLKIIENIEITTLLNEGTHHSGEAEVVRFLGQARGCS